ncbi:hypothetical protein EON64_02805 [archaeon]|nr:MAG: hypothetical protein EON64_02805 [archaeon]
METSSRQYGVPLLASQDFYDLLSNESQAHLRRLDVVTVKGSEMPIGMRVYGVLCYVNGVICGYVARIIVYSQF